jgi:hypothetical protein
VEGPGSFVTRVVYDLDGVEHEWSSRAHRKHTNVGEPLLRRWRTRSFWIAIFFMVGSACFAVGAVPGYVSLVGVGADGVTFFVGSIFFTSAAALQFVEVVNTEPSPAPAPGGSGWSPGSPAGSTGSRRRSSSPAPSSTTSVPSGR